MVEQYRKSITELKSLRYGQIRGIDITDSTDMHKSRGDSSNGKRARREIANNNERKRMQTINNGFQQLKQLLPVCEDDKISKSAVLQQAVSHINTLETDRNHVRRQNAFLIRRITELKKSVCSASCLCQGKCCSFSSNTGVAEDDKISEELSSACDQELRQAVNHLAQRLADAQAQLAAERNRSEVMESFISRILCQSAEVVSGSDSDGALASSQEEAAGRSFESQWKIDLKKELIDILPNENLTTTTSRRNLDTIVEAIKHLEGGDSSAIKRLCLANCSVPDDGSLKILCGGEGVMASSDCISFSVDSSQFLYSVDDQFQIKQDESVGAPPVAAFEFVSGEECVTILGEGDFRRVNVKAKPFIPPHIITTTVESRT